MCQGAGGTIPVAKNLPKTIRQNWYFRPSDAEYQNYFRVGDEN